MYNHCMDFEMIKNKISESIIFLAPVLNTNIQGLNITVGLLLLIITITIVTLQIIKFVKFSILSRIERFAEQKNLKVLDTVVEQINKIGNPFYITATLTFIATLFKELNVAGLIFFYPAFVIVCGFYSIGLIKTILSWFVTSSLATPKDEDEKEGVDTAFIQMVQTLIGLLTYVFVFLTVAQILGWNISTIVSLLGVSSIAVAFALQNILADVFAAFTIYIDQPFRPGDQIILSEFTGTVKKIGLKSTRISLLDGDELIVSNRDLTSARVRNLRKIRARRVLVHLVIDQASTVEQIKKAREIIVKSITDIENVEIKRINFLKMNGKGKEIEYVYNIQDEEYDAYCLAQETINFKILEGFEAEGIKLAKD
jgi:small-conductance mechanosensitive channel